MDDKIKEWLISFGLMATGVLSGPSFGGEKNTKSQVIAQLAVGVGVIFWLDATHWSKTTVMGITMAYGFVAKYIIRGIVKGVKNYEDKWAKKVEKKVDDFTN